MLTTAQQIIAEQTESCRILCPECSADRKKRDKTLSITVNENEILYHCHHCPFTGCIPRKPFYKEYETRPQPVTPIPTQLTKDTKPIIDFFAGRGVKLKNLSGLPPMTTGLKYFGDQGQHQAIGFVYGSPEKPDSIKWRACDKKLFTTQGAATEFYGIDLISPDEKEVLIVEGEADAVALASVGIKAIACPNGAPMKVSNRRISAKEDKKFRFLWEARPLLEGAEKIVLAIDQDKAGDALVEEIARRVGRAKCWRVTFPEECNDPNDVIEKLDNGKKVMLDAIKDAKPLPLVGVYTADDYLPDLLEIYRKGVGAGESTGLSKVDELITVKEGLLYIVTGVPSSGKSEFVDQIMVNLARDKSWKWAVASFENPPHMHIAKMTEKIVGKPFFEGMTPRMNKDELSVAQEFVNDHFVFLESKDGEMSTISSILERTKMAIWRLGVRGLVIDPYNYIQQEDAESEHASINKMLTTITLFAQAHGIAVFFVAHPAKMYANQNGEIPVPVGHHISGSAAWFSKADVGFTIHRGKEGVELHCWKMRFKWIGQQGTVVLGYDVPTGRYFDAVPDDQWSPASKKVREAFNDEALGW